MSLHAVGEYLLLTKLDEVEKPIENRLILDDTSKKFIGMKLYDMSELVADTHKLHHFINDAKSNVDVIAYVAVNSIDSLPKITVKNVDYYIVRFADIIAFDSEDSEVLNTICDSVTTSTGGTVHVY